MPPLAPAVTQWAAMRLAWFSPMPPVRTGIAACSAELVAALRTDHQVDVFVDEPESGQRPPRRAADGSPRSAHDFVWQHRQRPYDLAVYQLGNSSHHDYIWPYLFRYPGLTVLHDAHLHHARAAALLRTRRAADYRREFEANHADAAPGAAELAVAGFDNYLYYFWPMTRLIVEVSRVTAVHSPQLVEELRADVPGATVVDVRLGHGVEVDPSREARARARVRARYGIPLDAVLVGCFGGLTPDKRLPQVLDAFAALLAHTPGVRLLLAGTPVPHYDVASDVFRHGLQDRTTLTGYLENEADLTDCIAACDITLNLRWPTARELSGPWLRCLAAGKPTITIDLAHMSDVASLDPRTWTVNHASVEFRTPNAERRAPSAEPRAPSAEPITVAIDILDEDHSLRLAMRRLAADADLRLALGRAAQAWWRREHSLTSMVEDYRALIEMAGSRPPRAVDLPRHLVNTGDRILREVAEACGVGPAIAEWLGVERKHPEPDRRSVGPR